MSSYTLRSASRKAASSFYDLTHIMATVYDHSVYSDISEGGMGKMAFFRGDLRHLEASVVIKLFPAPLADLINHLRQVFHILFALAPQPLPPFFPGAQKKAREAAIKAHANEVSDTLEALNQSFSSAIMLFDYALGRDDWPEGKNIQPSVNHLARTQRTETATHDEELPERESQASKNKREDENDFRSKRIWPMVHRT